MQHQRLLSVNFELVLIDDFAEKIVDCKIVAIGEIESFVDVDHFRGGESVVDDGLYFVVVALDFYQFGTGDIYAVGKDDDVAAPADQQPRSLRVNLGQLGHFVQGHLQQPFGVIEYVQRIGQGIDVEFVHCEVGPFFVCSEGESWGFYERKGALGWVVVVGGNAFLAKRYINGVGSHFHICNEVCLATESVEQIQSTILVDSDSSVPRDEQQLLTYLYELRLHCRFCVQNNGIFFGQFSAFLVESVNNNLVGIEERINFIVEVDGVWEYFHIEQILKIDNYPILQPFLSFTSFLVSTVPYLRDQFKSTLLLNRYVAGPRGNRWVFTDEVAQKGVLKVAEPRGYAPSEGGTEFELYGGDWGALKEESLGRRDDGYCEKEEHDNNWNKMDQPVARNTTDATGKAWIKPCNCSRRRTNARFRIVRT